MSIAAAGNSLHSRSSSTDNFGSDLLEKVADGFQIARLDPAGDEPIG